MYSISSEAIQSFHVSTDVIVVISQFQTDVYSQCTTSVCTLFLVFLLALLKNLKKLSYIVMVTDLNAVG
jgi:hypothetical protein